MSIGGKVEKMSGGEAGGGGGGGGESAINSGSAFIGTSSSTSGSSFASSALSSFLSPVGGGRHHTTHPSVLLSSIDENGVNDNMGTDVDTDFRSRDLSSLKTSLNGCSSEIPLAKVPMSSPVRRLSMGKSTSPPNNVPSPLLSPTIPITNSSSSSGRFRRSTTVGPQPVFKDPSAGIAKILVEEVESMINSIGSFSPKLQTILMHFLDEFGAQRKSMNEQIETQNQMLSEKICRLEKDIGEMRSEHERVLNFEKSEREKYINQIRSDLQHEKNERKSEVAELVKYIEGENRERIEQENAMKDKLERDKEAMQKYLEEDAKQVKEKLASETQELQGRLEKETNMLKNQIESGNEIRQREAQRLQDELTKEQNNIKEKLEKESKVRIEMTAEEEKRRAKANIDLQKKMESEKKQQGNEITQMFDRIRSDIDQRRQEISVLRNAFSEETENVNEKLEEYRQNFENSRHAISEHVTNEINTCRQIMNNTEEDLGMYVRKTKNELIDRITESESDIRRSFEHEKQENRSRFLAERQTSDLKMHEEIEERKKEMSVMKNQIVKYHDDLKIQSEFDNKSLTQQFEKDTNDILTLIKKEHVERERDSNLIKERMENDKKELQICIDNDRENYSRKIREEHDQRRIESQEMIDRLTNNERVNKAEVQELFVRLKREIETRENELDDIASAMKANRLSVETKFAQERQITRDMLDKQDNENTYRLDNINDTMMKSVNILKEAVNSVSKASTNDLDLMRRKLAQDTSLMLEIASKTCSVMFDAHRDDSYSSGGEEYLTFSGCSVNVSRSMNPSSGTFTCPESGVYLFMITLCTFDSKKCSVSLRKNGVDVSNIFDQDGFENKGKTMIGQNVILELQNNDNIQLYACTGTAFTDHPTSRHTHFIGMLLRPTEEALKSITNEVTKCAASRTSRAGISAGENSSLDSLLNDDVMSVSTLTDLEKNLNSVMNNTINNRSSSRMNSRPSSCRATPIRDISLSAASSGWQPHELSFRSPTPRRNSGIFSPGRLTSPPPPASTAYGLVGTPLDCIIPESSYIPNSELMSTLTTGVPHRRSSVNRYVPKATTRELPSDENSHPVIIKRNTEVSSASQLELSGGITTSRNGIDSAEIELISKNMVNDDTTLSEKTAGRSESSSQQQSYLALTNLGMGKKILEKTAAEKTEPEQLR